MHNYKEVNVFWQIEVSLSTIEYQWRIKICNLYVYGVQNCDGKVCTYAILFKKKVVCKMSCHFK